MKNKIIYVLFVILLFSCRTTTNNDLDNTEGDPKEPETPVVYVPTDDEKIRDIINNMTLEEKIGQLFIFEIRNNLDGSPRVKVDDNLVTFLKKYKPGGIILFSQNVESNRQVEQLVQDLQDTATIPMFIGVDEEGGIVSRLGKEPNVDVTHLPSALRIGNKNNSELAYNSGLVLGRELRALGINMDMAPVADVNTNPNNPVIGSRTYSSDPHVVGEMITRAIEGFHEYNIASIIKHFPGHGDTSLDTHFGTVVSPHNRDRLDRIEFVPFKYGIEADVDAIMTAHMVMSGISSSQLPATLNHDIITGILREELGYDGIIITDALDMGAISQYYPSDKTAILSVKAGIDILLIPNNQPKAYKALFNAVKDGEITEERIDESLYRILYIKNKRGILDPKPLVETIEDVKNDPGHISLKKTLID